MSSMCMALWLSSLLVSTCVLACAYVAPSTPPILRPRSIAFSGFLGGTIAQKRAALRNLVPYASARGKDDAGRGGGGRVEKKPNLLFDQFAEQLPRMDGKVVAITGCTSGIGFVAARQMVRLGAILVMLNRPSLRAEVALQALRDEVDYKLPQLDSPDTADIEARVAQEMAELRVIHVPCDLLSFASVKDAYVELRTKFPDGLDVLCLNGGIGASPPEYRGDGFEPMMQTNHLSHFLLATLLLPSMESRAASVGEARIVSMTSEARKTPPTPLNPSALKPERNASTFDDAWKKAGANDELYHQSKLAVAIFAYQLHCRLRASDSRVKSVLAHPGLATTEAALEMFASISIDKPQIAGQVAAFVDSQAQSEGDGAMGLLKAMAVQEVECGDFIGPEGMRGAPVKLDLTSEELVTDKAAGHALWQASQDAAAAVIDRLMREGGASDRKKEEDSA